MKRLQLEEERRKKQLELEREAARKKAEEQERQRKLELEREEAIRREKQLKGGSRAKKIALIERDNPLWKDLASEVSNWS